MDEGILLISPKNQPNGRLRKKLAKCYDRKIGIFMNNQCRMEKKWFASEYREDLKDNYGQKT